MSDFENRLQKNAKQRFKWAEREKISAFRIYDLDMPEWPFAIDWYAGFAHVMEYPRRKQVRDGSIDAARTEVIRATTAALKISPEKIFTKTHEKHPWGRGQYERLGNSSTLVKVDEHGLTFECNLSDYLDTGLFLDHRVTRARVRQEAKGKRFLNLFAYTGSFTVHALAGGAAETTTVDLSNSYCDWAERNFRLNGFEPGANHRVLRADVLAWLEDARGTYDLIVLDPPSFSSSKKMGRRFEVQRDHHWLIERARGLLSETGALYFSTNFLGFELDERFDDAEPLASLPGDFRRTVHRGWRLLGRHVGVADAGDRSPAGPQRNKEHAQNQHPAKRR